MSGAASNFPNRSPLWPAPLLVVLATALAFAPVIGHSFTDWDDPSTVAANRDLNPPRWSTLLRYWSRPHMDLYVPVTYTAWAALAAVAFDPQPGADGSRLDPRVFHSANLVLHALSAVVVYALLLRLLRRASAEPARDDAPTPSPRRWRWAAGAGALLFALHPVQVEAVAWVSGLKDVLSGLLALLAVLLYVRHADGSPGSRWSLAMATLCYVLAMLAKPAAVATPLAALAIDRLLLRQPWQAMRLPIGLWLLLAAPVIAMGALLQPALHVPRVPVYLRPAVALDALAFYIRHIAWPNPLGIDYGRAPDRIWGGAAAYLAWLAPVCVAVPAWIWRRRRPWLAAGAAVFAATLIPVLGLVPFDFQRYSTVTDHYLYLAMLGPALLMTYGIARRPIIAPAAVVALAACALLTYRQAWHWRDSASLFAQAVEVNPQSVAGLRGLANLAMKQGDVDRAAVLLAQALRVRPGDGDTHGAIGNLLLRHLERPAEAIPHYERALAARPGSASIRALIGAAHQRAGNPARAAEAYESALGIDPRQFEARVNLALLLADAGQYPRALAHLEAARALDPQHPVVRREMQRVRALARGAAAAGPPAPPSN